MWVWINCSPTSQCGDYSCGVLTSTTYVDGAMWLAPGKDVSVWIDSNGKVFLR